MRFDFNQLCTVSKIMFLQFPSDKTNCELCSVNRNIYLFEKICNAADVVFMPVRNNKTFYSADIFFNVSKIRYKATRTDSFA